MMSLLFTICYILMFAIFNIDLSFFVFPGLTILIFYRTIKNEKVEFLGFFLGFWNLFDTKFTIQNFICLFACALYLGYYFWQANIFAEPDVIITYPSLVILFYFISFQEGTVDEIFRKQQQ